MNAWQSLTGCRRNPLANNPEPEGNGYKYKKRPVRREKLSKEAAPIRRGAFLLPDILKELPVAGP